jgi:hypothetical protein
MCKVSNAAMKKRFIYSLKTSRQALEATQDLIKWISVFSPGAKFNNLNLVWRLRMNVSLSLLPFYACSERRETTLPLTEDKRYFVSNDAVS